MKKYTKINEIAFKNWKSKYNFYWMIPISHKDFLRAKNKEPLLTITPLKKVPFEWYSDCKNKKILGIAAGGGQQMAILSALGGICTLFDISDDQIEADKFVSNREGYSISIIKGDMSNKLPFADETFDIIINPISNHYIDNIDYLFTEIYRVLKKGGKFIAGLETEIYWTINNETHCLENKLPFNPLKDKKLLNQLINEGNAIQFSHTTVEQIKGQLKAGFIIKDIFEDTEKGIFKNLNISTSIGTLSIK